MNKNECIKIVIRIQLTNTYNVIESDLAVE